MMLVINNKVLEKEIKKIMKGRTLGHKLELIKNKKLPKEIRDEIKKNIFTTKQKEVIKLSKKEDLKVLIHHGGTGSGKTYVNNFLFLQALMSVRQQADETMGENYTPNFILAGYKYENVMNNVIKPIEEEYGRDIKFDKSGNFVLFGVYVITAYLNSPRGEASIRGVDAWGAYVNELTIANRAAFEELRKRLRGSENSFLIADTNPDHPLHWVKTEYIDREDETPGLYTVHSTPEDNPHLPKSYVQDLYSIPPGPSRERALGFWTTGEGSVYAQFDPSYHYITEDELPDEEEFTEYFVGVDWGWKDPTTFLLLGKADVWDEDKDEVVEKTYLIEEVTRRQTHMEYWQGLAEEWMDEYGSEIPFYCDSAEQDRIDKLYEIGANAMNANKNISLGIASVTKLIDMGQLLVVEDQVDEFKLEINAYEWNERTNQPHDRDNHIMDALRYAIHTHEEEDSEQGFYSIY